MDNFPAHGRRCTHVPPFIRVYALVKAAAATANVDRGHSVPTRPRESTAGARGGPGTTGFR